METSSHLNGIENDQQRVYSGATKPGLTLNGSYDRVIWNGENDAFTSVDEIGDLASSCIKEFNEVPNTRLMIRTQVNGNVDMHALDTQLRKAGIQEHAVYFDQNECAHKIFAAVNASGRKINGDDVGVVQNHVSNRVDAHADVLQSPDAFRAHAEHQHAIVEKEGLRFCNRATADEMFELWGHPFGWSKKQCMQQASHLSDDERVYVLRDESGRVISGVYVADGETTEWATLPEYQRKGLIVPLLIYSHCSLIHENIRSVFAEARWNRSVSASMKSGLRIPEQQSNQWVLTNHVSIGDNSSIDPPDPWNAERAALNDNTEASMLRSFAVAHLDTELFTDDVLAMYLR